MKRRDPDEPMDVDFRVIGEGRWAPLRRWADDMRERYVSPRRWAQGFLSLIGLGLALVFGLAVKLVVVFVFRLFVH